jgi:hypothetical protein
MPSMRKRRLSSAHNLRKKRKFEQSLNEWGAFRPVGREFSSPDFERLMAEDASAGIGVFDPALKSLFLR